MTPCPVDHSYRAGTRDIQLCRNGFALCGVRCWVAELRPVEVDLNIEKVKP